MSSVRERGWGCAEGAAESHMECTEGYCTVTGFAGNFLYTCSLSLRASRSPVRKGFASSQTARDVSQNSENKVFRLWTLFWDSFGYPLGSILAPFWSPFGVVFDPLAPLGVSVGSCGVPLGLSRAPLRHFWCPLGFMGAMFANFNLFFRLLLQLWSHFGVVFTPCPTRCQKGLIFLQ